MTSTHNSWRRAASGRHGSVLVYSMYLMIVMFAVISLAVEYGHRQLVRSEMQRTADALARGALSYYLNPPSGISNGTKATQSTLRTWLINDATLSNSRNPIDGSSGVSPTITVTWGYWNPITPGFTAASSFTASTTKILAVKVEVWRSTANGNAIPALFPVPDTSGKLLTKLTYDMYASSIAALPNPVVIMSSQTVSPTGDPWLAGMPTGSTASDDDSAPAQSPTAVTVIPGSTLSFTNVTGLVSHKSGSPVDGPDGDTSNVYWHLKDSLSSSYATAPQGQGSQNGIGDLTAPIDSMIGLFLNSTEPDAASNSANANPTARNYSSDMNQSGVSDIKLQQPFYIGDGTTTSGATQTFVVPGGATQMYLGIMDGYEWNNNVGSFTIGALTEQPPIQIVQ